MNRILAKLLRVPLLRSKIETWLLQVRTSDGALVPLAYVEQEDGTLIVLGSAEEDSTWWRHLRADEPAPVDLRLQGEDRIGRAVLLQGEDLDEAMLAYLHRFPRAWMSLGVEANATEAQVGEAARSATVVRISLDAADSPTG